MMPAMLLMIGGCLMMLEPILRRPVKVSAAYLASALREAFVPPSGPCDLESLLEKLP